MKNFLFAFIFAVFSAAPISVFSAGAFDFGDIANRDDLKELTDGEISFFNDWLQTTNTSEKHKVYHENYLKIYNKVKQQKDNGTKIKYDPNDTNVISPIDLLVLQVLARNMYTEDNRSSNSKGLVLDTNVASLLDKKLSYTIFIENADAGATWSDRNKLVINDEDKAKGRAARVVNKAMELLFADTKWDSYGAYAEAYKEKTHEFNYYVFSQLLSFTRDSVFVYVKPEDYKKIYAEELKVPMASPDGKGSLSLNAQLTPEQYNFFNGNDLETAIAEAISKGTITQKQKDAYDAFKNKLVNSNADKKFAYTEQDGKQDVRDLGVAMEIIFLTGLPVADLFRGLERVYTVAMRPRDSGIEARLADVIQSVLTRLYDPATDTPERQERLEKNRDRLLSMFESGAKQVYLGNFQGVMNRQNVIDNIDLSGLLTGAAARVDLNAEGKLTAEQKDYFDDELLKRFGYLAGEHADDQGNMIDEPKIAKEHFSRFRGFVRTLQLSSSEAVGFVYPHDYKSKGYNALELAIALNAMLIADEEPPTNISEGLVKVLAAATRKGKSDDDKKTDSVSFIKDMLSLIKPQTKELAETLATNTAFALVKGEDMSLNDIAALAKARPITDEVDFEPYLNLEGKLTAEQRNYFIDDELLKKLGYLAGDPDDQGNVIDEPKITKEHRTQFREFKRFLEGKNTQGEFKYPHENTSDNPVQNAGDLATALIILLIADEEPPANIFEGLAKVLAAAVRKGKTDEAKKADSVSLIEEMLARVEPKTKADAELLGKNIAVALVRGEDMLLTRDEFLAKAKLITDEVDFQRYNIPPAPPTPGTTEGYTMAIVDISDGLKDMDLSDDAKLDEIAAVMGRERAFVKGTIGIYKFIKERAQEIVDAGKSGNDYDDLLKEFHTAGGLTEGGDRYFSTVRQAAKRGDDNYLPNSIYDMGRGLTAAIEKARAIAAKGFHINLKTTDGETSYLFTPDGVRDLKKDPETPKKPSGPPILNIAADAYETKFESEEATVKLKEALAGKKVMEGSEEDGVVLQAVQQYMDVYALNAKLPGGLAPIISYLRGKNAKADENAPESIQRIYKDSSFSWVTAGIPLTSDYPDIEAATQRCIKKIGETPLRVKNKTTGKIEIAKDQDGNDIMLSVLFDKPANKHSIYATLRRDVEKANTNNSLEKVYCGAIFGKIRED